MQLPDLHLKPSVQANCICAAGWDSECLHKSSLSSELSPQSLVRSQVHWALMHFLFLHWNSSGRQSEHPCWGSRNEVMVKEFCWCVFTSSSSRDGHSAVPLQREAFGRQMVLLLLQANWSALHKFADFTWSQLISSERSPQSSVPSQTSSLSMHLLFVHLNLFEAHFFSPK